MFLKTIDVERRNFMKKFLSSLPAKLLIGIIVGIIIGLIGIVGVSLAYPFYSYILERERKKIAPEIIRLSDELLK